MFIIGFFWNLNLANFFFTCFFYIWLSQFYSFLYAFVSCVVSQICIHFDNREESWMKINGNTINSLLPSSSSSSVLLPILFYFIILWRYTFPSVCFLILEHGSVLHEFYFTLLQMIYIWSFIDSPLLSMFSLAIFFFEC